MTAVQTPYAQTRHRLELTQEQMADLLGVSFASVNRWEQPGATGPRGLAYEVYGAIDTGLRLHRVTARQITTAFTRSRGYALRVIFTAAYPRQVP